MKKAMKLVLAACFLMFLASTIYAIPTIYPTGTTIYKPEKCWNGFTVFPSMVTGEVKLIDMNGNVVGPWKGISGFPAKILPGGYLMGYIGTRPNHQDDTTLVQVDWNMKF